MWKGRMIKILKTLNFTIVSNAYRYLKVILYDESWRQKKYDD